MDKKIGHYAFLAGITIALLAGLFPQNLLPKETTTLILIILGLIVGFMNITARETTEFLAASVAIMLASTSTNIIDPTVIPTLGEFIKQILNYIVAFVAPAAIVVAIKAVYILAED